MKREMRGIGCNSAGTILCLCCVGVCAMGGDMMVWDAGIGLRPEILTHLWTWQGSTPAFGAVAIEGGVLTLTSPGPTVSDSAMYAQRGANVIMPTNLWVEVRARWVSGTDYQVGRSPMAVWFTTLPRVGNTLFLEKDRMFVMTGTFTEGDSAMVDTDDNFHTYCIEVTGTIAGSPFTVYYDGAPMLSGTLFDNATNHGDLPRVAWGEGTKHETGVSQWAYVAHNASAIPGVWLWSNRDPLGFRVSWSTATYGFHLQRATNLVVTSSWQDDTNTPAIVGHEKSVIISDMESGFFRLISP